MCIIARAHNELHKTFTMDLTELLTQQLEEAKNDNETLKGTIWQLTSELGNAKEINEVLQAVAQEGEEEMQNKVDTITQREQECETLKQQLEGQNSGLQQDLLAEQLKNTTANGEIKKLKAKLISTSAEKDKLNVEYLALKTTAAEFEARNNSLEALNDTLRKAIESEKAEYEKFRKVCESDDDGGDGGAVKLATWQSQQVKKYAKKETDLRDQLESQIEMVETLQVKVKACEQFKTLKDAEMESNKTNLQALQTELDTTKEELKATKQKLDKANGKSTSPPIPPSSPSGGPFVGGSTGSVSAARTREINWDDVVTQRWYNVFKDFWSDDLLQLGYLYNPLSVFTDEFTVLYEFLRNQLRCHLEAPIPESELLEVILDFVTSIAARFDMRAQSNTVFIELSIRILCEKRMYDRLYAAP